MKTSAKAWINIIVYAILLVVNYVSSTGLINNTTQKEMSDKYLTPITPASFTFSIWGVIYVFIFISLILMVINRNRISYKAIIDKVSPLFWVSSLFNVGWIIIFLYDEILISTIFIVVFTLVLGGINKIIVENSDNKKNTLALSFGLYNGWVLIATIVNIAVYLVKIDWNRWGLSEEIWGITLLSLAFVITIAMMIWLKNAAFPLPAAWACFGIYQFINATNSPNGDYSLLASASIIFLVLLTIGAILQFKLNKGKIISASRHNIYL